MDIKEQLHGTNRFWLKKMNGALKKTRRMTAILENNEEGKKSIGKNMIPLNII